MYNRKTNVYDSPLLSLLSQLVPSAQTTCQDGDDEGVASSTSARGELVKLLVEHEDVSPRLPGPLASAAKAVRRRLAVQRSYQPHVVTEPRASQRSHTNSVSNIKSHRNVVGKLPDSHKHRRYSPGLPITLPVSLPDSPKKSNVRRFTTHVYSPNT